MKLWVLVGLVTLSLACGLEGCGKKPAASPKTGSQQTPATGSAGTNEHPADGTPKGGPSDASSGSPAGGPGVGTPEPGSGTTPAPGASDSTPKEATPKDATPAVPAETPGPGVQPARPLETPVPSEPPKAAAPDARQYRLAMIARTQSSLASHAARAGAEDAAADLSSKLGVEIKVVWQTPAREDAARQAAILEQAVSTGAQGIILSSSNPGVLASAVEFAHDRGVPVVCFESDAPGSSAFVGAGEEGVGRAVMQDLAQAMGEKGRIAVLAGGENDAVAQARLRGLKDELERYPGIALTRVVTYSGADEGASDAREITASVPGISGWAILGPWPSLTEADIDGMSRGARIVAADAFPAQLRYVESGKVQSLVGQDYYAWGYEAVRQLTSRLNGEKGSSAAARSPVQIERVTRANVEEMQGKWGNWLKGIGK